MDGTLSREAAGRCGPLWSGGGSDAGSEGKWMNWGPLQWEKGREL